MYSLNEFNTNGERKITLYLKKRERKKMVSREKKKENKKKTKRIIGKLIVK